jgi:hypothetical protein
MHSFHPQWAQFLTCSLLSFKSPCPKSHPRRKPNSCSCKPLWTKQTNKQTINKLYASKIRWQDKINIHIPKEMNKEIEIRNWPKVRPQLSLADDKSYISKSVTMYTLWWGTDRAQKAWASLSLWLCSSQSRTHADVSSFPKQVLQVTACSASGILTLFPFPQLLWPSPHWGLPAWLSFWQFFLASQAFLWNLRESNHDSIILHSMCLPI